MATQAGKLGVSCLLKVGCYVSQISLCFVQAVLGQDGWCMPWREMRGSCVFHWLIIFLSCFMCFYVHLGQSNRGNGQYPAILNLLGQQKCSMQWNYLSGTHQIKETLILFKFLLIHLSLLKYFLYYQTHFSSP